MYYVFQDEISVVLKSQRDTSVTTFPPTYRKGGKDVTLVTNFLYRIYLIGRFAFRFNIQSLCGFGSDIISIFGFFWG